MLPSVDDETQREPLLTGGGAVRVEDFCRATGLDEETVDELMRTGHLEGGLVRESDPSHVVLIHDDVLPTRQTLVDLALPVRDDYNPDALRLIPMVEDDPDGV